MESRTCTLHNNKDNVEKSNLRTNISDREETASRFESIFAASPAHLKQRQSPSPHRLSYYDDDKTKVTPTKQSDRYYDNHHGHHRLTKTPSHHAPMTPSSAEVSELREKNAALEKKLDELTSLVAKLAIARITKEFLRKSQTRHRRSFRR